MKVVSQLLAGKREESLSLSIIHPAYFSTKKQSRQLAKTKLNVSRPQHFLPHVLKRIKEEEEGQERRSSVWLRETGMRLDSKGGKEQIGRIIRFHRTEAWRGKGNVHQQFKRLADESRDYLQFYFKKYGTEFRQFFETGQQRFIILTILKSSHALFQNSPPQLVNRLLLTFRINPVNDFHRIFWREYYAFEEFTRGQALKRTATQCIGRFFLQNQPSISYKKFCRVLKMVTDKVDSNLREDSKKRVLDLCLRAVGELLEEGQAVDMNFFKDALMVRGVLECGDVISLLVDKF